MKDKDEYFRYHLEQIQNTTICTSMASNKYDEKDLRRLADILDQKKNVHAYPILVEGYSKIVVQAEHTLIPTESGVNIITL